MVHLQLEFANLFASAFLDRQAAIASLWVLFAFA
jgi:hypothetical protein